MVNLSVSLVLENRRTLRDNGDDDIEGGNDDYFKEESLQLEDPYKLLFRTFWLIYLKMNYILSFYGFMRSAWLIRDSKCFKEVI